MHKVVVILSPSLSYITPLSFEGERNRAPTWGSLRARDLSILRFKR